MSAWRRLRARTVGFVCACRGKSTLAVLLLGTLLVAASCGKVWDRPRIHVRIGTNNSRSFNFYNEDRHPRGFGVEVLNRAAQRANIDLEWVTTDLGPDDAFAAELADVWPVVTYFERRKENLYLTKPWWRLATILYSREDMKIGSMDQLAGYRLALTSPSTKYLPKMSFLESTHIQIVDHPETGLLRLCKGEVDAALIDFNVAEQVLLNRPKECTSMRFSSLSVEDGVREFSVGARFGFEDQAERLRTAIDEMAADGELLQLAAKWKFVSPADPELLSWLQSAQRRTRLLSLVTSIVSLVLLISFVALFCVRRSMKKAQLSASARARFLANMSHEIRTPMNGILGMTELALGTELTAEQREYLSLAHESGQRLLQVLNDILEISRVESGKLAIESIAFDLREVARRSLLPVALQAQEKCIEVVTTIRDSPHPGGKCWMGDPGRVEQVLINLLSNAMKFTPCGGRVELTIDATAPAHRREDGSFTASVNFAVADNGIGIPTAEQGVIFDSFTQADASTTRQYGGTGLGLAISARLVEMMGGKLAVQSEVDCGSKFYFSLPLVLSPPVPADVETPRVIGSPCPRDSIATAKSVLIAEDNAVNRLLVSRILKRAGYAVTTVEDGAAAVDAFASSVATGNGFDAILMDITMPVMDGFDATRKIRMLERDGQHVPIIALTALAIEGDESRCLEAGMDAYIAKPFEHDNLLDTLAGLAGGGERLAPARNL
jgi:signal transduction histidine kinase/ActR/RegA family two-component response regulator